MSAEGHQPAPRRSRSSSEDPRSSTSCPGVTADLAVQGDPCQCRATAVMGDRGGSVTDNRSTGLWAVTCGVLVAGGGRLPGTVCGQQRGLQGLLGARPLLRKRSEQRASWRGGRAAR